MKSHPNFARTGLILTTLLVASTITLSSAVLAQAKYPSKPITVIVPYAPGGSSDMVARVFAKSANKHLGQPLVIINKPGAAAQIGLNELAGAKPDGYTVGVANSGMLLQPLIGKTKHNYALDLDGIVMAGQIPFVLAVRADAPYTTLEDFIKFAKENPGKIKYGHTGVGNSAHTAPEQLSLLAGIKMDPVPYDGGAPLIASLLGGHIQAVINNPVDLQAHIKAGKIKVLAVAGSERIDDPLYKDIPTFKEKGYDINVILFQGFAAPKGIPAETLQVLREGFEKIAKDPETLKAIADLGLVPKIMDGKQFGEFWASEQKVLNKTLEDTGILKIIKEQKN